ncbi:MAG: hypothetical protein GKR90_13065 [Pseudomonadales bacterium]|nr:hypothetical protein [Pseudomonadales bacterium]
MSKAALAGIRVLDLCDHRGEMAGRVLADLGAEVICVEPPDGSKSRLRGPFNTAGESLWWATFALGKKSVALDLASPEGRDDFLDLIATADVCLESFLPGVLENLELDYDRLAERNPRLIVASITPFGQDGPRASDASTDLTLEASGGLIGMQGDTDRPPIPVGFPQASLHAGVQAAADVLIALYARETLGTGQHLDVSAQSAVVWTLMNATGWPSVVGVNPPGFCDTRHLPRATPVEGMRPPRLFECKDGHATFGVHLPGVGERTMAGAIEWLRVAHPDLVDGELLDVDWTRWMSLVLDGTIPVDVYNRAFDTVADAFQRCNKTELLALAVEKKLLIAPVLNTEDLFRDEQLLSRDFWQDVGGISFAGPFAKLSKTPISYRGPAPKLDADRAILESKDPMPVERFAGRASGKRALAGLKVADFAWVGVGPIMSKALADHGADVIHIESSQRLDVLRTIGPFKDRQPGPNRSHFFNNFNTNKKSIDLNFKDPSDLEFARRIADWADVIVESFVPGNMAKYGLDYETLAKKNPQLVMMSTCMRGQTGPHSSYGGFGNQGAALAGLFSITGWPDRAPVGPWGAYTDFIAPRFGVAAILAALHHRTVTGEGQYIDLSQIEAGIQFMGPLISASDELRVQNPGMDSLYCCPHGVYTADDGMSFVAIAVENDIQWQSLARVLGFGDEEAGWGFQERVTHKEKIDAAVTSWISNKSAQAGESTLLADGVPAHQVLWPTQLYEDPQLVHRNFFQELDHPEIGMAHYDGHVTKFSSTPPILSTAGPVLGQHSEEIRKRFADDAVKARSG